MCIRDSLRAVHAGHHHVEQDEVGGEALHLIEGLLAAGAAQHLEAADSLEGDLGHGLDRGIVLDVKDALEFTHGPVSYTHLDVYKRQARRPQRRPGGFRRYR